MFVAKVRIACSFFQRTWMVEVTAVKLILEITRILAASDIATDISARMIFLEQKFARFSCTVFLTCN